MGADPYPSMQPIAAPDAGPSAAQQQHQPQPQQQGSIQGPGGYAYAPPPVQGSKFPTPAGAYPPHHIAGGYPPQPAGAYPPQPAGAYPPQPAGVYSGQQAGGHAPPAQGVPIGMQPMSVGTAGAGGVEKCRCTVGWVLFGLGFLFIPCWFAALFVPLCTKSLNDRRAALASAAGLVAYVIVAVIVGIMAPRSYGYTRYA